MKSTTTFLLVFLSFVLNAQNVFIYDKESNIPVSFATISYVKESAIIDSFYCDKNGFCNLKNNNLFDKIEFSCIGYEKKIIYTVNNDTVFLTKKVIVLNDVIVSSNKNVFSLRGYTKYKKKITLSAYKGFEICTFVDNSSNTEKRIKSFLFKTRTQYGYQTAIRVHFYNKELNKISPGNENLNEDIIFIIDGKTKKTIEVDVSKYNLELPIEGAFVGIEWLGVVDDITGSFVDSNVKNWKSTSIEFNDSINEPVTFFRNKLNNNWENTEKMKTEFIKIIKYKNYPNASFGIKVYE